MLVSLLGHRSEDLLHLIHDVVQFVRMGLQDFVNSITHCRLKEGQLFSFFFNVYLFFGGKIGNFILIKNKTDIPLLLLCLRQSGQK